MVYTGRGCEIYYERAGAGPDVVTLHGWGGCINSFAPLIRDLSASMRVTSVDFPSFGKSPPPEGDWGVNDFARELAGLMLEAGIERADIVAHSFGGRVAIVLANKYPELVNRLILTGVPGIKNPEARPSAKTRLYRALKRVAFTDSMREKLIQIFGSADYRALAPSMRATFNKIVSEDLTPYLPNVTASTLLIWGEEDTAAPLWMARVMEEKIPDAGLVVFEGADHFAYLKQYPRFLKIVANFLSEGGDKANVECH